MADQLDADELGEGAEPAAPKGNRNLIIMGIMTAAWVGGGAGMYFATAKQAGHHAPAAEGGEAPHGESAHGEAPAHGEEKAEAPSEGEGHGGGGGGSGGEGSVVTLASFIANLTPDVEGDMHYLKCTLAVALADPSAEKLLEQRTPRLRNQILMYLSGLKMSEIEGTENKRKLVTHLVDLANEVMGRHKVDDIYLTEFVVQ